jgi:hypothetical protein
MTGLNITRRYSDGKRLYGVECTFSEDNKKYAIWLDNRDVVKSYSKKDGTVSAHITEDGCVFLGIR